MDRHTREVALFVEAYQEHTPPWLPRATTKIAISKSGITHAATEMYELPMAMLRAEGPVAFWPELA